MALDAANHAAITFHKGSPKLQDILLFDEAPFFIGLETAGTVERSATKCDQEEAMLVGSCLADDCMQDVRRQH
eukprot:6110676-Karenia_brevis.AAC.1